LQCLLHQVGLNGFGGESIGCSLHVQFLSHRFSIVTRVNYNRDGIDLRILADYFFLLFSDSGCRFISVDLLGSHVDVE
jgi:hypothetical protein